MAAETVTFQENGRQFTSRLASDGSILVQEAGNPVASLYLPGTERYGIAKRKFERERAKSVETSSEQDLNR